MMLDIYRSIGLFSTISIYKLIVRLMIPITSINVERVTPFNMGRLADTNIALPNYLGSYFTPNITELSVYPF